MLARIIAAIWQLFNRHKVHRRGPRKPSRAADVEAAGRWYFRRAILDQLPHYFETLARVRRADAELSFMLTRLGAVIASEKWAIRADETLTPAWRHMDRKLAFGAVSYAATLADPVDHPNGPGGGGRIIPSLITFLRFDVPPPHVQPAPGQHIYQVQVFYTDRKRLDASGGFYVAVTQDGIITPLKMLVENTMRLPVRNRAARRIGGRPVITTRKWQLPVLLDDIDRADPKLTADDIARVTFTHLLNTYEAASCDVRVRVEKDGRVAVFSVDLMRMPYFFQDRGDKILQNGRRRPIFHIVRTHERRLAGGRTTFVRTHFRGSRNFTWGDGYRVNITMPGYHHMDMLGMDVGMHDFQDALPRTERKAWLTLRQAVTRIDQHLNR